TAPPGRARGQGGRYAQRGRVDRFALGSRDRSTCPDGGAPPHEIVSEPPADLLQALAHARQPDTPRGGVLLADQLTHAADARHAFAGILDRQHDSVPVRCALAHETDLRRRTARMSGNVGQSFLHDTEQYQFPIRRGAVPPTARCRAPPRCCCAPGSPRYNGEAPSPIPPRRVAADGEDRKTCEPHGSIAEACLRGVEGPAARPPAG